MKHRTGLLYSEAYTRHLTGPTHPERPERIRHVYEYLKKQAWFEKLSLTCPNRPPLADLEWIHAIHTPAYTERVKNACLAGHPTIDSLDTEISHDSYETARLAAGGVLSLIDKVMSREVANGFSLIRPPGHHAEKEIALGFCLFNHAAIAARYLQKKHGLGRILIVDWDVHHGNGTQNIFYEDPSVFYFSVHQFPYYPGTGSAEEQGKDRGLGATLNVPLKAGCGDAEYREVFEKVFYSRASEFEPDFVLISAGFDAHQNDPLGHMNVTAAGYEWMTDVVKAVARKSAQGRIVSLLEGGYDLDALAESVGKHVESLLNPDIQFHSPAKRRRKKEKI